MKLRLLTEYLFRAGCDICFSDRIQLLGYKKYSAITKGLHGLNETLRFFFERLSNQEWVPIN